MKTCKLLYIASVSCSIIYYSNVCYGQATSSNPLTPSPLPNTPFAPGIDFLGWAAGVGVNLNIRHDGNFDIDSWTSGFQWHRLERTGLSLLSDNFTFGALDVLHLHRDNNISVFHRYTNGNTGTTVLDGFRIGIRYNNDPPFNPDYSIAELRNYEDSPENLIRFIFPVIFPTRIGI